MSPACIEEMCYVTHGFILQGLFGKQTNEKFHSIPLKKEREKQMFVQNFVLVKSYYLEMLPFLSLIIWVYPDLG